MSGLLPGRSGWTRPARRPGPDPRRSPRKPAGRPADGTPPGSPPPPGRCPTEDSRWRGSDWPGPGRPPPPPPDAGRCALRRRLPSSRNRPGGAIAAAGPPWSATDGLRRGPGARVRGDPGADPGRWPGRRYWRRSPGSRASRGTSGTRPRGTAFPPGPGAGSDRAAVPGALARPAACGPDGSACGGCGGALRAEGRLACSAFGALRSAPRTARVERRAAWSALSAA